MAISRTSGPGNGVAIIRVVVSSSRYPTPGGAVAGSPAESGRAEAEPRRVGDEADEAVGPAETAVRPDSEYSRQPVHVGRQSTGHWPGQHPGHAQSHYRRQDHTQPDSLQIHFTGQNNTPSSLVVHYQILYMITVVDTN